MISVAMTTYNGALYLKKQLDSILFQTMAIDELIICDDGSSDETKEIIQDYQKKYPQIHFYENKENLGYKLNFKKAMDLCCGDYIFLCDQDDIWMEDKVEKMINKIKENPKIQVLASSFVYINQVDEEIETTLDSGKSNNNLYLKPVKEGDCVPVSFEEYYNHNYFQGCSLLLKKEIKNKVVNHFSIRVAHDYLINFTAAKEEEMYFWNVPLFKYRLHENNTIGVVDQNINFIQKMRNRNTLKIRSLLAVDGISMLEALKETDPSFYKKRESYYENKIAFYKEHLKYLEDRNLFGLLFENKNPYYKEFKGFKARMMDLLYAMMG